jgi:hypothetical protein
MSRQNNRNAEEVETCKRRVKPLFISVNAVAVDLRYNTKRQ